MSEFPNDELVPSTSPESEYIEEVLEAEVLVEEPQKEQSTQNESLDDIFDTLEKSPEVEIPEIPSVGLEGAAEKPAELSICDCGEQAFSVCQTCRKRLCKYHVSKESLSHCPDCWTLTQKDRFPIEYREEPLVDDDGVTHSGKRIIPIGDTYTVTAYLDTQSDLELEVMLSEYSQKIKDAEHLLYSRVIIHNTIRGELSERDRKKRLEKRTRIIRDQSTGEIKIGLPTKPASAKPRPTPKAAQAGSSSDLISSIANLPPAQKALLATLLKNISQNKSKS